MKIWCSILALAGLMSLEASAQVTVQVTLDQNEFLPRETLEAVVRITNRSGQTLHLGADPKWLTFFVESADGFIVDKLGNPPVAGKFKLGSSQVAIKRVNLAPYFSLTKAGHYRVTATVNIPEWNTEISSPPKGFDIISGAKLWSQTFGVPSPAGVTNRMPEVRKYSLEQANYLRSQLRLYVMVSDASGNQIFKVRAIGPMVSFSQPEVQIDRQSKLHVLWQTGASAFTYSVIDPAGDIVQKETYDYFNTRPRLHTDATGNVSVFGGVRRVTAANLPTVTSPEEFKGATNP